jgi:alpha-1,2-mannosyltransferase
MARRSFHYLCVVIIGVLLVSLVLRSAGVRLVNKGVVAPAAMIAGLSPIRDVLTFHLGYDSWAPMFAALHQIEQHPETPVYQTIFFDHHRKFQYPLTSLLPFWAAERMGLSEKAILEVLRIGSWLAVCIMAAISAVMGITFLRAHSAPKGPDMLERVTATIGIVVGCLLFYPFMRGYELGQVQTFLSLGFSVAFFCWALGRERTSGAILGGLALVKPQYAILLIWMILRRKKGASISLIACAGAGLILSLIVFGWHQNIDYLRVLQTISRQGEAFYSNQSVNGVLNRLLGNGINLEFEELIFPPFNQTVYIGTLISSFAILALALFFPWRANKGTIVDFACIALAATMASPVAWDHHYGILFPIFIWLWFGEDIQRRRTRRVFGLTTAYILASNCLNITNVFANEPLLNFLQSCLFVGGLITFGLLLTSPPADGANSLRGKRDLFRWPREQRQPILKEVGSSTLFRHSESPEKGRAIQTLSEYAPSWRIFFCRGVTKSDSSTTISTGILKLARRL